MEGWSPGELENHLWFHFLWQKSSPIYLLKGAFVLYSDHSMAFHATIALLVYHLFQLSARLILYRKRNNRQSFILNSEEVIFQCFDNLSLVRGLWNPNQKIISGSQDSNLKSQSIFFQRKTKPKPNQNTEVDIWKTVAF